MTQDHRGDRGLSVVGVDALQLASAGQLTARTRAAVRWYVLVEYHVRSLLSAWRLFSATVARERWNIRDVLTVGCLAARGGREPSRGIVTGHPGSAGEDRSVVEELSPVTLLVAGPPLALLGRWQSELSVLRRRSPGSDAVATLANCVDELADAIKAGRDTRLLLTIAEAHAVSHIPVSTLRWLCKRKADLIGAQKHQGVWYMDRIKFERYLPASGDGARAPRAAEAA